MPIRLEEGNLISKHSKLRLKTDGVSHPTHAEGLVSSPPTYLMIKIDIL